MRPWACLLMLAACREGGLVIDVTPSDPSIDHIRLYVGRGEPTTGVPLRPPGAAVDSVAYWSRDPGNELDHAVISPGETTRFVLVPTDTEVVPVIIAVGYADGAPVATGSLFDLPISSDQYAVYGIEPAAPVTKLDLPSEHQVGAWSADPAVPVADAACIGVLEQRPKYPRAFIVTDGDPDCDGLPTDSLKECVADSYLDTRPAKLDELTCLVPRPPEGGACWLGGPACHDGQERDLAACDRSRYCLPDTVCNHCASLECASDVTTSPLTTGRYTCQIAVSPNGDLCQNEVFVPSLPTAGARCTSVAIRGGQQGFDDHLEVGGVQIDTRLDPGCQITFKPSGTPSTSGDLGALFAIDLDDGRGLASPVVFTLKPLPACPGVPVPCRSDNTIPASWPLSCTASPQPWGPPTLVTGLVSSAGNDDPTLTGDMLEIYFNNSTDTEIRSSTRASLTAPWSTADVVTQLGTGYITSTPEVTPDGMTLYFNSNRVGGPGGADIFVATRAPGIGLWSTPNRIPELATPSHEYGATTDAAQRRMIFNSDRLGAGYDLFEVTRVDPLVPWGGLTHLTSVSSQADEINPFLSTDGLTVYFYSPRVAGQLNDLYVATRTSTSAPFGPPTPIDELNTASNDVDPWVSPDGRTMFFASDRSGTYQIYETRR